MSVKDKFMRVMELALTINPPEVDDVGKGRVAVFVTWFSHCSKLDVAIHHNGWEQGKGADERYDIYTSWEDRAEELDQLIDRLEAIVKENEE